MIEPRRISTIQGISHVNIIGKRKENPSGETEGRPEKLDNDSALWEKDPCRMYPGGMCL